MLIVLSLKGFRASVLVTLVDSITKRERPEQGAPFCDTGEWFFASRVDSYRVRY